MKELNFQIKYKDAMGRIGILKTPHGNVKTPAFMPVIHPGKQTINVKKYGAEIVITNAYIIYKNLDLKNKALKIGVHGLIDFNGPVVTDSGSFQLSEYGDIDVSNREIIEFQEKIGADIGTSLDIPTPPFVSRRRAEKELDTTIKRAKEALEVRDNIMLNSVVQGSTYSDLRAKCATILGEMDFQVFPMGAVVPLLESYKFSDLLDVTMASVTHLPDSRPRHLMGAGHPMIFAFAVAIGCDFFDSASYILYAENDRLMTPTGTYKLENLSEMPCSCKICNDYTPNDLKIMEKDERVQLIAQHNLHISFAEIRKIKQAIIQGSLLELMEQRCRVHPQLLDAVRNLKKYTENLERYDPVFKKSAFFYSGPESLNRPEIFRHLKRLDRLPAQKTLFLIPSVEKPYLKNLVDKSGIFQRSQKRTRKGEVEKSGKFYQKIHNKNVDNSDHSDLIQLAVVDVPFGIIPLEIDEIYPLAQNEAPIIIDEDSKKFVKEVLENYTKKFHRVIVSEDILKTFNLNFGFEYGDLNALNINIGDRQKIEYIADYQFGHGVGKALFKGDINIIKSKKTSRIRHIYHCEKLIATIRARDGAIVLAMEGAIRLHKYLKYPKNRVVVSKEAEPFAREGKSIFAKFVINCDMSIRANEEVLIVNENDDLLAFGKSILNGNEIMDFLVGQAVKTRKGGK